MGSSCQRCELRAENSYKNMDDRQKFFLVPLKGDFQQAVTIPGELVERFRGEIPAQISLQTRNRNSHTVGVTKYPDKIVFTAGWAALINTYDLHTDGSMLLRYTGDSQFNIIIFDQFGCEEPFSVLEDYACLPPYLLKRHIDATGTTKCCENCAELDEYKYHNLDNKEKYFLVSVKGDFQHEMTVPEEFVQCFRGDFPEEIRLYTRNGESYHIGIAKRTDKLAFSEGWGAFVKTYDLRMDDSMVLKYNGHSRFNVIILSRVGCEKAKSVVVSNASVPPHFPKRRRADTTTVIRAHDHPESMQMQSPPRERQICLRTDSASSQRNMAMPVFSAASPSLSDNNPQLCGQLRYSFSKKTHLSDNQKKRVEEVVRRIPLGVPIFVAVICKSNVSGSFDLNLPTQYVKRHLGRQERTILLRRGGKSYEAKLCINGPTSRFSSGGWRRFVKEYSVEVGDICVFELLKEREMCTMNVHIIRAYEVADG
ncbi:hypothetical protein ACP70R_025022 [Stipagrostis hirtigluma subsp. patula]